VIRIVAGQSIYLHAQSLLRVLHMKDVSSSQPLGKADLHVHTRYSGLTTVSFLRFPDSVSYPDDVVKAAERRGLDVLCVTDHNSIKGAVEARKFAKDIEIVTGAEIETLEGDLLALFISEDIPKDRPVEETIDMIHAQGGLAIVPHPFSSHCDALGRRLNGLKVDGVEVFNAAHRDGYSNEAARILTGGLDTAFVGSSDAHATTMVGNAYTTFEGNTAEDLRRAILAKKTSFVGKATPLKDLVWMTVNVSIELWKDLTLSLVGRDVVDGTELAAVVSSMRTISKVVSIVGATGFLVPPMPAIVGVLGDNIHRRRSKYHFDRILRETNGSA
jgi:predicted metal-dependent phosphoesterase TrpH